MTFTEFWPLYLQIHSKKWTKIVHAIGTILSAVSIVGGFVEGQILLGFLIAPLLGYGCAWSAHLWIQHNFPETFRHPIYSFMGDMKMTFLLLTGQLPPST